MSEKRVCPECSNPLEKVIYPAYKMLNEYQWDSIKAGDYFCIHCKSDAAKSGYKYFWERDIKQTSKPDLKLCSHCGRLPDYVTSVGQEPVLVTCSAPHKGECVLAFMPMTVEYWNKRPVESTLRSQLKAASERVERLSLNLQYAKDETGGMEEKLKQSEHERYLIHEELNRVVGRPSTIAELEVGYCFPTLKELKKDEEIEQLQQENEGLRGLLFSKIEQDCHEKMLLDGNTECRHRRGIIAGLGGCICKPDNCYKMCQLCDEAPEAKEADNG